MGAFHQVGQRRVERCRKVKYTLNETPPFSHLINTTTKLFQPLLDFRKRYKPV